MHQRMPKDGRESREPVKFPIPELGALEVWDEAYARALKFWKNVMSNEKLSTDSRKIGKMNFENLTAHAAIRSRFGAKPN